MVHMGAGTSGFLGTQGMGLGFKVLGLLGL